MSKKNSGFVESILEYSNTYWIVNVMELLERLAYYGVRSVIALYMVLPRELGGPELTHKEKGLIFLWWAAFQSLLPMFTGGFADRYGHKKTIVVAILIKIAGYIMMAQFQDFWGFFWGCMFLAIGTAIFKPGVQGTLALNLKDKNALVCASSQGLGKAAAMDLAAEGVNLAICSRDKEKIEACKKEIQDVVGNKAKIIALQANLDNPEEIKILYAEAAEYLGSVDILVNNTGGPPPSIFENLEDEDWQKAFNSTMMSCIRLSKLALPSMKEKKWGRIINISSVSVKSPVAGLFLSNSLRMGVLGWAKALSDEVAPFGVTVNTVCPGYTRTERVEAILESQSKSSGLNKEEIEKNIASNIPMQRVGEAEDLAGLITFLASQKADYMTGLAVQVDGGSARTFT